MQHSQLKQCIVCNSLPLLINTRLCLVWFGRELLQLHKHAVWWLKILQTLSELCKIQFKNTHGGIHTQEHKSKCAFIIVLQKKKKKKEKSSSLFWNKHTTITLYKDETQTAHPRVYLGVCLILTRHPEPNICICEIRTYQDVNLRHHLQRTTMGKQGHSIPYDGKVAWKSILSECSCCYDWCPGCWRQGQRADL